MISGGSPATLQRRAGNRAISGAVQRIRIGPTEDASEHEAALLAPLLAARLGGSDEQVGGGRPLPPALRAGAEQELGTDLTSVRVHTGPAVDRDADRIDAAAFTRRDDVYMSGGELGPGHFGRSATLAHELTHVVQQRGGSSRVRRAATPGVVQRVPKGHELAKTPQFQTAAVEFEKRLGFYAYNHERAPEGAVALIKTVQKNLWAMYEKYRHKPASEADKTKMFHRMLKGEDEKGIAARKATEAGQVGDAVVEALESGNLRERYTMLYNALRNPTFKVLFIPGQEYQTVASFLTWKGERHSTTTQTGGFFNWLRRINPFRKKRDTEDERRTTRTGATLAQGYSQAGRTYAAPLSAREQALQFGGGDANQRLRWEEGTSYYQVDQNNPWVKRVKGELGMPVSTGPSGTTVRMIDIFDAMNMDQGRYMQPFLLGLVGWMMTSNDHSFHEIMSVAKAKGRAPYYEPGVKAYHTGVPLIPEPDLRDHVAVDKMFPDEHAYVHQVETGGLIAGTAWGRYQGRMSAAQVPVTEAAERVAVANQFMQKTQDRISKMGVQFEKAWAEFVKTSEAHPSKNKVLFEKQYAPQFKRLKELQAKLVDDKKLVVKRTKEHEQAKQRAAALSGGLNPAHLAALNVYTSPAYNLINSQYRSRSWWRTRAARESGLKGMGGAAHYWTSDVAADAKLHGQMIERALTQLPPYTGPVLYRGDPGGGRAPGTVEVGDSFTSTSKSVAAALGYANGTKPGLIVVNGPTGGRDISRVTWSTGLQQVLVPPGKRFTYGAQASLGVRAKDADPEALQALTTKNTAALAQLGEVIPAEDRQRILSWATTLPTEKNAKDYPFGMTLTVMIAVPSDAPPAPAPAPQPAAARADGESFAHRMRP